MQLIRFIFYLFLFCFLTVLTQVGGLIFLMSFGTRKFTDRWAKSNLQKTAFRWAAFLILYSVVSFIIVPRVAKPLGRVPLPITETRHLQPLNVLTCLLNRNYVRPAMRELTYEVAENMHAKYSGSRINYLEANFPFINKFPLLPHLSHNDGKKLDLSFCYRDAKTNSITNDAPAFIGYGICEEPKSDEKNATLYCENKGYWQYSYMTWVTPQYSKKDFTFDGNRTRELLNQFVSQKAIGKIFIEPHLRERLGLKSRKIRFHGCQAVRHDDHIHVQLK